MSVLVLVVLAIVWLSQTIFMVNIYGYIKRNNAKRSANIIAENIDVENIETLANQISLEYEVCITIVDCFNNTEKCDVHYLNDCILHSPSSESFISDWYNKAKSNDGVYTETIPREKRSSVKHDEDDANDKIPSDAPIDDCLVFVKLVKGDNGYNKMVIINSSIRPVNATLHTLRIQLIAISVIVIVSASIIAYILSRRISAPISNINKTAKNLTLANYDVHFSETGTAEITELAQTLNATVLELKKVEELQKELIANISHDLRTPLTMISGYTEIMRDIPDENTPENMQIIIDETARLSSLIKDMLDVSKLQSNAMPIKLSTINLTDLIRQTLKRYEKLVLHEGFKISFESDYDVFIEADEIRLLQVLYNLLNNAINYTGDDKFVFVYQSVMDDTVRISVRDTGEGISEENLPYIWDRYYKVDKVHRRSQIGSGLGLSIVKNILILHGSRFGVSSEVGKGSTFWFEFKIVKK